MIRIALHFSVVGFVAVCAVVGLSSCATTKNLMSAAVRDQAEGDLVSDTASISARQIGVASKYQSQRQGTVERATWAADGCGAREVYTVECIRGVCLAARDVVEAKKQKLKERVNE